MKKIILFGLLFLTTLQFSFAQIAEEVNANNYGAIVGGAGFCKFVGGDANGIQSMRVINEKQYASFAWDTTTLKLWQYNRLLPIGKRWVVTQFVTYSNGFPLYATRDTAIKFVVDTTNRALYVCNATGCVNVAGGTRKDSTLANSNLTFDSVRFHTVLKAINFKNIDGWGSSMVDFINRDSFNYLAGLPNNSVASSGSVLSTGINVTSKMGGAGNGKYYREAYGVSNTNATGNIKSVAAEGITADSFRLEQIWGRQIGSALTPQYATINTTLRMNMMPATNYYPSIGQYFGLVPGSIYSWLPYIQSKPVIGWHIKDNTNNIPVLGVAVGIASNNPTAYMYADPFPNNATAITNFTAKGIVANAASYYVYKNSRTGFLKNADNIEDTTALVPVSGNTQNGKFLSVVNGVPSWATVTGSTTVAGWGLTGNAGTTPLSNYIGTSDAQDLVLKTNSVERARIAASGNMGVNTSNPLYQLDVNGDVSGQMLRCSQIIAYSSLKAASHNILDKSVCVRDAATGYIGETNLDPLVVWNYGNENQSVVLGTKTNFDSVEIITSNIPRLTVKPNGIIRLDKQPNTSVVSSLVGVNNYIWPQLLTRNNNTGEIEMMSPYELAQGAGLNRTDTLTAWVGRTYNVAPNAHNIFINKRIGTQLISDSIVFNLPAYPINGQEINLYVQKMAKIWTMDIILDSGAASNYTTGYAFDEGNGNATNFPFPKARKCIEFSSFGANNPNYSGTWFNTPNAQSWKITLNWNEIDGLWNTTLLPSY